MWGLRALLPMLAERGLKLDWVISGVDYNVGMTNPPALNDWGTITGEGAKIVASMPNQPQVFYEIWNEPDLPGLYWNGTLTQYYNSYFPAAYRALRANDPNAKILNGGLVLGNTSSGARDYLSNAAALLSSGNISMLAMHSHHTLDEFLRLWTADEILRDVDPSKILLNECGLSMETENGTVTDTDEVKAFHSAGKVLAAHRLGLAGIVMFHAGGLPSNMMQDLQDNGHYYSYMFTLTENRELQPTAIYSAAKTVIAHTKGLSPAEGWPLEKSNGGYVWLFEDGDKKTLACIKRLPTDEELIRAFGGKYAFDAVYDISGSVVFALPTSHGEPDYDVSASEALPSENSGIQYYVKAGTAGDTGSDDGGTGSDNPPEPQTPSGTEAPDSSPSDSSPSGGSSGCSFGLAGIPVFLLISAYAFYSSRR